MYSKPLITASIYLIFGIAMYFILPESFLYTIGFAMLFACLSSSWDLVVGYTGQINLGHTTFVGLGAYITSLFISGRFGFSTDLVTSLLLSILTSASIGVAFGAIALRLKGYYFALVTAILPLVFMQSVFVWSELLGGEEGFSIGLEKGISPNLRYPFALATSFIILLVLSIIVRSRVGMRFMAVRDSEELAESLGINTTFYKVIAFTLSSMIAGFIGSSIVLYRLTVAPDLYSVDLMLLIILASVIGGLGTIYGPFFFGILIYLLKVFVIRDVLEILSLNISDEVVLYSMLIAIAIVMPEGVARYLASK